MAVFMRPGVGGTVYVVVVEVLPGPVRVLGLFGP